VITDLSTTCLLARRIEQVEAENGWNGAVARRRALGQDLVIDRRCEDDATAVFAGHWTHFTQGFVLQPEIQESTVVSFEKFFTSYFALTTIHVSNEFTEAVAVLRHRGYTLLGSSRVVALLPTDPLPPIGKGVIVDPDQNADEWSRIAVAGFTGREPNGDAELELGVVVTCMDDARRYVARVHGTPAGTAATYTSGNTAILFCDSTLMQFRGRGVHTSTIAVRARAARKSGADLIIATVQPGTASERNYLRCGFRSLYSRLTFRKP
jgi:hypothetical protein